MAYCTVEDLISAKFNRNLLEQLDAKEPGCVQTAIDNASAHMDTYLNSRYSVPVTLIGALGVLRLCCVALARYEVLNRLGVASNNQDVVNDYEYWLRQWLPSIRSGTVVLPSSDSETDASDSSFVISVKRLGSDVCPSTPLFSWEQIKDF